MPTIPVRGVGDIGVVTDVQSYDLPINAWGAARNVRFRNKSISRSGAFKALNTPITLTGIPQLIVDASVNGIDGCIVVPQKDGVIRQLFSGVNSNVSPTVAWGPATSRLTSCRIGAVTYLNNFEGGPLFRANPTAPLFARLPGWSASDTCFTLRAFKDYVIALNVTKSGVRFPNMIKWSDVVQAGAPPPNWDVTSLSSNAGENVLNDSRGTLVDGLALGNTFILYGSEETYRMDFIGTPLIFSFDKLFDDLGVFGQDCAVEIDGKHYVFGSDGIYIHDGVQKINISEGKVSERIYGRLDFTNRSLCFAFQNPTRTEIIFCYPSKSSDCAWTTADSVGCNEAAIYNYSNNTWSFIDVPGVNAAFLAALPVNTTWADLGTWDTLDGSWRSYEGSAPQLPMFVSTGSTPKSVNPALYFFDDVKDGFLANVVDQRILFDGYVVTSLKDTDEMGATLGSTKLVRTLFPQAFAYTPESYLDISVGYATNPTAVPVWSPPFRFFPATEYKCDYRVTGRYLNIRFVFPAAYDCLLSGYDINMDVIAER